MKYKPAPIKLKDIDINDTGFKITTRSSIEDLLPSIIDHGIINPPIIAKKTQGAYLIVSGFRRIADCIHLDINEIDARIIETDETPPLDIIKIAICDNTMQRQLNLVEESNALNLLSECIDDETELARISDSLGLPGNVSAIRKIRRLSSLPEEVQKAVAGGRISLVIAMELGTIEKEAAIYSARLFETLKIGLNKQREVLCNLMDIAKREDITIMDIFSDSIFKGLIDDAGGDTANKRHAVRNYLRVRRLPEISKAEKTFKNRLSELKLKNSIKLLPPKSFEGEQFELIFRFKDLTDLKYYNDEVTRMIDHPAMMDILLKQ